MSEAAAHRRPRAGERRADHPAQCTARARYPYRDFIELIGSQLAGAMTEGQALLFTDVIMPDVDGPKLAEATLCRRPNRKVLYTTGYARDAIVHDGTLDPGQNLIGKPFDLEQLAKKVAMLLER